MASIEFWGGVGTVTGSKYLVQTNRARVLVDCGLFQGLKELRERNWQDPPFDPGSLNAVLITHAHIDHTGYLPRLVQQGFRGPVYCSRGTADLLKILLPDAGRLQEEDADYRNRHNLTKHNPALPLYTEKNAFAALRVDRAFCRIRARRFKLLRVFVPASESRDTFSDRVWCCWKWTML